MIHRRLKSFASRAEYNAANSERFWCYVQRGADCWRWTGVHSSGRATVTWMGRPTKAARIAWELTHGPIPADRHVLHSCDNPSCVRPDHLRLGTHQDNMRDIVAHGYHHHALKTHCPAGHPYSAENTVIYDGKRQCRQCRRAHQKAYRHRLPSHPLPMGAVR